MIILGYVKVGKSHRDRYHRLIVSIKVRSLVTSDRVTSYFLWGPRGHEIATSWGSHNSDNYGLWHANNELVLQHVLLSPGIPKVLQYIIYI
jgi:hypothetical protein